MEPYTIGIISDTHRILPEGALAIMRGEYGDGQVIAALDVETEPDVAFEKRPVDLIIHAGDIGGWPPLSQDVLNELERVAPICAVLGNCDVDGYIAGDSYVDWQMEVIEPCGVQVAVMHRPEDLSASIRRADISPRVRIHGHTHVPKLERIGANSLLMCPGSPTKPRGANPQRTVALLHLANPGKVFRAEIVKL